MYFDDMRKNVMYIFNDTSFGGAGQSLLDTLAEIRNRVNPIVIIRDDVAVEDKFIEIGIQYYKIHFSTDYVKIGSADANQRRHDIQQSYDAARQLVPIIERENVQLIHINSSTSYFAAIAALMAEIPYIWHIRELMKEQFGYEFLNEDLKVNLYKKANRLIVISDFVQKKYYEKYGLETFRLYNGLNIQRFKRHIDSNRQSTNTFIVAAMITPEKGQWDVIRATELLVEKGYNDIKVVIVGKGFDGYVWALKKYIKEKELEKNIHILPFQDDLSQLRSHASYAITSSQNEALGRVTIEAMLAGNLVIGARSGGTTEIIGENEERGFLYELGNSKALADTMERAINCNDGRKRLLLQKAQEYAEDTFDSKQYCRDLLKIYDEVMVSFESHEYDGFLDTLKEYCYSVKTIKDSEVKSKSVPYRKSALMLPIVLRWLEIRQNGHSLGEYFKSNNIQNLAIYGMGALGCRLYDELEDSNVEIRYLLDKKTNGMDKVFEFASFDKDKLEVDMIVVTVISSEKQIIDEIKKLGYDNVIGLSAVIDSFDLSDVG